jgi:serum/glucocorticoid-regulated kinase 2
MCITSAIYVRPDLQLLYDELIFRTAPYIPPIDPSNASDTQNFDETFLDMEPIINDENDMDTDQEREQTDQEPTDGEDSVATPSQSRSSSAHPPNDLVDVFDGYSFKGRHSVIIDDEEEVSEGEEEGDEEEEEDQDVTGRSILAELNGTAPADTVVTIGREEPTFEPKTPEARPAALPPTTPPAKRSPLAAKRDLPPVDTNLNPASIADATPRASEETAAPTSRPPTTPIKAVADAAAAASMGPDIHRKEQKKGPAPKPHGPRSKRTRREKSGVPALDRDLSDANDEDEVRTERDEEDDDWDFIEADGEDRNGARGNNLFARGVVDRYRLAVFRKGSTPNRAVSGETTGLSALDSPNTPSPTTKERRGRTGALHFRRTPKNLLRTKSPRSTARSAKSPGKLLTTSDHSASATVSTVSSPQSVRTTLGQPSLKSKESTVSVSSPGSSSDTSTSGDARGASDADVIETVRISHVSTDEQEKQQKNNKKLKRGAEKMLSLFASPR